MLSVVARHVSGREGAAVSGKEARGDWTSRLGVFAVPSSAGVGGWRRGL